MARGFKPVGCQTNPSPESSDSRSSRVHLVSNLGNTLEGSPADQTALAAQVLFHDFYQVAFMNRGVVLHDDPLQNQISQNESYAMEVMANVGQDLRRIAEQIERSQERHIIRRRADDVNVKISTYEHFAAILRELFPNGQITREGIVVLFFFCSDVAFRAYSSGPIACFHQLINWSLRYIYQHICDWVRAQGGWKSVISGTARGAAVTVCAVLGSVAFAMYIKNNLI
ncbi:uncharacterized protein LOC141854006 isoform X2 [Brevipalpus obovatus]|uniref:uncharacterized protein LOC141854006 isoform X2 n=1 Tax=Brevipalpus obovatus TaxID=246614 RepID=UPI003D9E3ABA